jgi:hypothetical protein
MDPYLERSWGDVHTRLVFLSSTALNKLLPEDLIARVEERVAIESGFGGDEPQRSNLIPDARVFETAGTGNLATQTAGSISLAPYRLELLDEAPTERFVEIIDVRNGERLISVLEFISPTNKKGDGLKAFLEKRNTLVAGGVNFIEIDLVREGNWRKLLNRYRIPSGGVSLFRAVIHVPGELPAVFLQPISLRQPLPIIKIPLRANDQPCELALQPLIEEAYESGRYSRTIDYRQPCEPPLEPADAAWARDAINVAIPR